MEVMEFKEEFEESHPPRCCGCLSFGRKLQPIGKKTEIYNMLISQISDHIFTSEIYTEDVKFCWECHSKLQSIYRFQKQVVKAREIIKNGQDYIYSLSSLTTVVINDSNLHTIYMSDANSIKLETEQQNNISVDKTTIANAFNDVFDTKIENYERDNEFIDDNHDVDGKSEHFGNANEVINANIDKNDDLNNKKLSRWAEKRAQQNKKPKFRILKHNNDNMLKMYEEFQCLKCDLKFSSKQEFCDHYKDWHEKYICHHCGVSFKMRYCIKNHLRKQHSPFECKTCGKNFARYNGLWLHNKLRHAPPAPPAYCVECDKQYPDVYRYRWHLANSARHKPKVKLRIPCPECDKVFSKKIYMTNHRDLVHLKQYRYRCEPCDKNFIRNADLVKHNRRTHEGILPPRNKICYVCGRGFTTNKILTNHLRTHTGERPFACTLCPARFAQNTALRGHTRAIHHNSTTE